MIKVSYESARKKKERVYTLTLTGHAGAGKSGADLVCSAASMLFYTALQSGDNFSNLDKGLKCEYLIDKGSGLLVVTIPADDKEAERDADTMFGVILTGFTVLSKSYPDNVQLDMKSA